MSRRGLRQLIRVGLVVLLLAAAGSIATAVFSGARPATSTIRWASGSLAAVVGPGPVERAEQVGAYRVEVVFTPNRASALGAVSAKIWRRGRPVNGAQVRFTTLMLTMPMGYTGLLHEVAPGRYTHAWPPLEMTGRWRLRYEITPPHGKRLAVSLVDQVG